MHEKNSRTTGARNRTVIGLLIVTAGMHPAFGAPWDFNTVVDLGINYSDNLRLAPEGQEESDFIYTIAPTFRLSTEGDRLTADISYRPQAVFYDTAPEADSVFHVVDATTTTALVRNALFLDATATNFQSIVSPDARVPTGNLPISGNRIDTRIITVRPYWEQSLGFADVLAEVTYVDTSYDDVDTTPSGLSVQGNNERRALFDLNNHSQQQGIAWGLGYQYRRLEYDDSIPWDYQQASANLGYWVGGNIRLFVTGGVETAFDNFVDSNLDDGFWEAGLQYRPNQRLDVELAVGERGYGDSYRGRLSYQLRRGQTTLSYTEEPASLGDSLTNRRPLIDSDNLDDFFNRPGASDRFIRKRGDWTTTFSLAKSELSLRLFFEERFENTTATGQELTDEEQRGAALRWSWRFGSRSTLGFVTDYSKREIASGDSTLLRLAVDYAYQISERLSVVVQAQRSDEDSSGGPDDGYVENQYRLSLRAGF